VPFHVANKKGRTNISFDGSGMGSSYLGWATPAVEFGGSIRYR
jgi:hypothetical protein